MMFVTLNLGLQLLLHHNLSLVYLHSEENEYLITMCMLYPIPLHDILLCIHVGTYGQYCMHPLSYVLYGKRYVLYDP